MSKILNHWFWSFDSFRFCEPYFTAHKLFVGNQCKISPFLCGMSHTHMSVATQCNTLQHTATHCNRAVWATLTWVWQHSATRVWQHSATHYNTLQRTATHCNTLQHTATHCNTLQHTYPTHEFVSITSPVLSDSHFHLWNVQDLREWWKRFISFRFFSPPFCSLWLLFCLGGRCKIFREWLKRWITTKRWIIMCVYQCVCEYVCVCVCVLEITIKHIHSTSK